MILFHSLELYRVCRKKINKQKPKTNNKHMPLLESKDLGRRRLKTQFMNKLFQKRHMGHMLAVSQMKELVKIYQFQSLPGNICLC